MLYSLEPSVSLTGGPWYTDNELDTEFIKHLTDACLKFIRDLVCIHFIGFDFGLFPSKSNFLHSTDDTKT